MIFKFLNFNFSGNNNKEKISGEKHLERSPQTKDDECVRKIKMR